MPVVDTLVTRYVMDAADYKRGASDVQSATAAIVGQFKGASVALTGVKWAAGIVGGGLIGAAAVALKSAASWEVLVKQLSVVTGSMERANQIAKFSEQLAGPSAFFDTQQLAESAKLLETMSLNTERFLPLVSTMASLFGGSTEKLMEFTMALGKLRSGVFGEAFERMREFGISMDDLRGKGLDFSKSGEFKLFDGESVTQSAERALSAVEKIIKEKFGGLDAAMQDSMAARFTSLFDALGRGAKTVGLAIMERIKEPFSEFVTQFEQFISSGAFEQAASSLAKAFDFDKMKDGAVNMLSAMYAGFKQLPRMITSIQNMLKIMWDVAIQAAIVYASIQAGIFGAQVMNAAMAMYSIYVGIAGAAAATAASSAATMAMLRQMAAVGLGLAAAFTTWRVLQNYLKSMQPQDSAGLSGFSEYQFAADSRKFKEAIGRTTGDSRPAAGMGVADAAISAIQGTMGGDSEMSRQTAYLAAIERNTAPMRTTIMGGGNLGAKGVTATDLSTMKGGRGKWGTVVKALQEIMDEETTRKAGDMLRLASPYISGR